MSPLLQYGGMVGGGAPGYTHSPGSPGQGMGMGTTGLNSPAQQMWQIGRFAPGNVMGMDMARALNNGPAFSGPVNPWGSMGYSYPDSTGPGFGGIMRQGFGVYNRDGQRVPNFGWQPPQQGGPQG